MSGDDGLTEEEKAQALYHARQGIVALISEHPELVMLDADHLTTTYLAGVRAGVEAAAGVFDVVARRQLGEES